MESKFTKSLANKGTENRGLALLLTDPRFQAVDAPIKRRILELIGIEGAFGIQTFDAVMTGAQQNPITLQSIDDLIGDVTLIEMKTTRKPIKSATLHGFFFGATEREYAMAKALGDRYRFAFIVLNETNEYGRPFAVLLPLAEVERRTRAQRIQYQVNFRSDTEPSEGDELLVFGSSKHIPSEEPTLQSDLTQ
ncbi:MAG: DUF3883 domain-containing protein [Actinomycetota bacterium]|nr:DUF3883 domain-containing protein [Actinomycetota bacterium]